jgi:hypothetical protein
LPSRGHKSRNQARASAWAFFESIAGDTSAHVYVPGGETFQPAGRFQHFVRLVRERLAEMVVEDLTDHGLGLVRVDEEVGRLQHPQVAGSEVLCAADGFVQEVFWDRGDKTRLHE